MAKKRTAKRTTNRLTSNRRPPKRKSDSSHRSLRPPDSRPSTMSEKDKVRFLEHLAMTNDIAQSCEVIGISRRVYYNTRKEDDDFAESVVEIQEAIIDLLESTWLHRTITGWEEPVFQMGEEVGSKQKHSPSMAQFFLKANRGKYRVSESGNSGASHDEFAEAMIQAVQKAKGTIPLSPDEEMEE